MLNSHTNAGIGLICLVLGARDVVVHFIRVGKISNLKLRHVQNFRTTKERLYVAYEVLRGRVSDIRLRTNDANVSRFLRVTLLVIKLLHALQRVKELRPAVVILQVIIFRWLLEVTFIVAVGDQGPAEFV